MKAVNQQQYGGPQVLALVQAPTPEPSATEVVVAVCASAVTQGDRRLRAADFPGISAIPGRLMLGLTRPRQPVPGSTFAGRVVAVGADVRRWQVGDEVFGLAMHGAWAEQLRMPEDGALARKPAGLSFEEAAALPYGAGTAVAFLRDLVDVQAGERVLVAGAAGGVGRYAVQLAHHLGAEVTAVCSAADADLARALGADEVLDYRDADFWTLGRTWDVVFDTSGAVGFGQCRGALSAQGRYATLEISVAVLWHMAWTAWGRGPRAHFTVAMDSAASLEAVAGLVDAGALRPRVARTFGLDDIAAAHRCLEAGGLGGEVVVAVAA